MLLIIMLFRVDLRNLVRNTLYIAKDYNISITEIDKMQFWRYEWFTDEIKEIQKEQEKQRKEEDKKYNSMSNSFNTNSMMRNMQHSMSNFSMPKVSMPKI